MAKVIVWLHTGGKRYRLPADADLVEVTGSEFRAIKAGTSMHVFSHETPHDVHVARKGKRGWQKGAWRAADHRHGRFAFRTPMVRRWTR